MGDADINGYPGLKSIVSDDQPNSLVRPQSLTQSQTNSYCPPQPQLINLQQTQQMNPPKVCQPEFVGLSHSSGAKQLHVPALFHAKPQKRRGCMRCIECSGITQHHPSLNISSTLDLSPITSAPRDTLDWWPGGLQSPTLYFHLRTKQLEHQCRHGVRGLRPWRADNEVNMTLSALAISREEFVVNGVGSSLKVHVPLTCTNIPASATGVEFIGNKTLVIRVPNVASPSLFVSGNKPGLLFVAPSNTAPTPFQTPEKQQALTSKLCSSAMVNEQQDGDIEHEISATSSLEVLPGSCCFTTGSLELPTTNTEDRGNNTAVFHAPAVNHLRRTLSGSRRGYTELQVDKDELLQGVVTSANAEDSEPKRTRLDGHSNSVLVAPLGALTAMPTIEHRTCTSNDWRCRPANLVARKNSGVQFSTAAVYPGIVLQHSPAIITNNNVAVTPLGIARTAREGDSISCDATLPVELSSARLNDVVVLQGRVLPTDPVLQAHYEKQYYIKTEQAFVCHQVVDSSMVQQDGDGSKWAPSLWRSLF